MALEPDCRLAFGLGGIFLPAAQAKWPAGFVILRSLAQRWLGMQGKTERWMSGLSRTPGKRV